MNRALYGLKFIKSCITKVLRRRLVTALVVPHLDYCTVVYLDAPTDLRTRLQRLSDSCVRYIYGLRMRERITPHRKVLGWLRTDTRRMYFAATLMYKIHRSKQPKYLADHFRCYQPRGPTRGERKDWAIPIVRTYLPFKLILRIHGTPCLHLCTISCPSPA